ncbi:MAG: KamA family radical SAM protein [Desulfatitalea sp.]|nr:KamA family radical SAM protein [Desulfatitalea sp.]
MADTCIDRPPAGWGGTGEDWVHLQTRFPMRINPYFYSLIKSPDDPLGRQVIPSPEELQDLTGCADPLAEERQSPAPQVIHRYPGRVVLLVSEQCAVHCRFCMRKRRVAGEARITRTLLDRALTYIRRQSDIHEVILSGGDPLMLNDEALGGILTDLRAMGHVRRLRIHTRIPSVLPQRVTPALAALLATFHPLYVNIHFNHSAEITPAAAEACRLLADAGIPLGSQTVLLKGVNDDPDVLTALMEDLLGVRVKPYYLHLLDRVPGTRHFQVPIERGLALLAALRGPLSGMGMPHLMVDLPGGGGKVALTPDAIVEKGPDRWRIRNWQSRVYRYP